MRTPTQPALSLFKPRVIVWFSRGAASAVSAWMAVQKYPDTQVVYCDLSKDEHPDGIRFHRDVEKWIGKPIQVIRSEKYESVEDVFDDVAFMSSLHGAPCSREMKRVPRERFQNPGDWHIFGYTADEAARIAKFEENNPELYLIWNLRDHGIYKQDCYEILESVGIELPIMYKLGLRHNNCLGCVKSTSPKYWNDIRRLFPDVFARRAAQSRRLGVRLVRYKGERIFLDELPEESQEEVIEDISCGPVCDLTSQSG